MDIEYRKIRVPGHQDVPEHSCQKFFRVVDSFLRDNRHNGKYFTSLECRTIVLILFLRRFVDKLIGIHCTHGINRSGYFIVRYCFVTNISVRLFENLRLLRYLIEVLGLEPNDAISGEFYLVFSCRKSSFR